MADEIKWIKTQCDLFNNRKIKQIEVMPEGDAILIIWVKLLCLAGSVNDNGYVYLTPEVPYTDELLANEFRKSTQLIRLALATFVKFGMIEIIDNILHVSNWAKYQNVEGMEKVRLQNRIRKQKQRERDSLKLLGNNTKDNSHVTSRDSHAIDKDIEEDKELDIYNNQQEEEYIKNARARVIDSFSQELCRPITPIEMQLIISWEMDYGSELVLAALKEAVVNNKRSFKYIEAILVSWKGKGIRTAIEAQQEIEQFNNRKIFNNSDDVVVEELMKKDVPEHEKKLGRLNDLKVLMELYAHNSSKCNEYKQEYERLLKELHEDEE